MAGDMTAEEIAREYELDLKDIEAAFDYAADLMEHEKVFALSK